MGTDYDRLYRDTPDALGPPTAAFVGFFDRFGTARARVLDLGCGQGRDALFIARRGHRVVGVDRSAHGIRALAAAARREGLDLSGVVADIVDWRPEGRFDVIVLDRVLHMLGASARRAVLGRLPPHLAPAGWVLIADEPSNIAGIEAALGAAGTAWRTGLRRRGLLFLQRADAEARD